MTERDVPEIADSQDFLARDLAPKQTDTVPTKTKKQTASLTSSPPESSPFVELESPFNTGRAAEEIHNSSRSDLLFIPGSTESQGGGDSEVASSVGTFTSRFTFDGSSVSRDDGFRQSGKKRDRMFMSFSRGLLERALSEEKATETFQQIVLHCGKKDHPCSFRWNLFQRFRDLDLEGSFAMAFYGSSILYLRIVFVLIFILYIVFMGLAVLGTDFEETGFERTRNLVQLVLRASQLLYAFGVCVIMHAGALVLCFRLRRKRSKILPTEANQDSELNDDGTVEPNDGGDTDRVKKTSCSRNSLANVLDFAVVMPFAIYAMLCHGILSGLIFSGDTSAAMTPLLVLTLILRVRVVPTVLIASCSCAFGHIVSLVVRVWHLQYETDVSEHTVLNLRADRLVFSVIEVILLGVVSLTIVASQYEANARRLFVANTRWQRICLALERESLREEALVENVYPVQLLPHLKLNGRFIRFYEGVAALVNDISGFTAFSGTVDTQELFRFLNDVYSCFDDVAENTGVIKIKTIGDSWFGIHTNLAEKRSESEEGFLKISARMATIAAWKMNTRFQKLCERGGESEPYALQLRSGVSIGSAWIYVLGGDVSGIDMNLTFDVVGEPVSRARKLEALGTESEVWVCEDIQRLLSTSPHCKFDVMDDFSGNFRAFRVEIQSSHCRHRHTPAFVDHLREEVIEESGVVEEKKNGVCGKDCLLFLPDLLFRQEVRACEDCYYEQVTFIRLTFGISAVLSIFYAVQTAFDTPFVVHSQVVLLCLAGMIVLVCLLGIACARKSRFLGIALQWLLFVLFHVWGLGTVVVMIFAPSTPHRYASVSGYTLSIPFVTLALPSIPYLVKLLGPIFSLLMTIATIWTWDYYDFEGLFFNSGTVYLSAIAGMTFHHVQLLRYHRKSEENKAKLQKLREGAKANERLLESALPSAIADRLIRSEGFDRPAEFFEVGGSLFCEVICSKEQKDLILSLEKVFRAFDAIVSRFPVVKVKTTGTRYLCVTGIFYDRDDSVSDDAVFLGMTAREILRTFIGMRENHVVDSDASLKIGLHVGSFCGGLCGKTVRCVLFCLIILFQRWLWDVFGDTINVACRLCESARNDEIHCSEEFARAWKGQEFGKFQGLEYSQLRYLAPVSRGPVHLKGKGQVESFLLIEEEDSSDVE